MAWISWTAARVQFKVFKVLLRFNTEPKFPLSSMGLILFFHPQKLEALKIKSFRFFP